MKKTEEQYLEEWKLLAKKYAISVRVLRHVRNSYLDKYSNLSHQEAIDKMIEESNDKLKGAKPSYRAIVIGIGKMVLKEPGGLDSSDPLRNRLRSEIGQLYGYIDKIGFRKSIIRFLRRLPDWCLKEIVEYKF